MDPGIYSSELRAPALDLTLRRGAAVHAGAQPVVRQAIARLLVDGPRTEAELLQTLVEVGEKSVRPMQSMLKRFENRQTYHKATGLFAPRATFKQTEKQVRQPRKSNVWQ